MEKEFVPYELAVKLKELGFDEPCFRLYKNIKEYKERIAGGDLITNTNLLKFENSNYCASPTFSQAFRWFREEHYLISSIYQLSVNVKTGLSSFEYMIDKLNNLGLSQFIEDFPYNTYEEAELACLEKLIEIVESKSE
jgi:hypothetical protein